MKHKYDLFEKFPDGSSLWRACVVGLSSAQRHMGDLAIRSPNQFYAMHLETGKVVLFDVQRGGLVRHVKAGKQRAAVAA